MRRLLLPMSLALLLASLIAIGCSEGIIQKPLSLAMIIVGGCLVISGIIYYCCCNRNKN